MQNLLQETKFILDKYNIRANKSLGQNFLTDENVVNEIVESARNRRNRPSYRNWTRTWNTNSEIARKIWKGNLYRIRPKNDWHFKR